MIDFIDVTIPFQNDGEINNGYKDSFQKDQPNNRKYFFIPIRNKHGAFMQVVSVGTDHIRIIGNPANFIQNQNVFGTDDIIALTAKVVMKIAKRLGVKPTRENRRSWKTGDFEIHRIDITYNFVFPSQASVSAWLDKAFFVIRSGKQEVGALRFSTSHHVETINVGKRSSFISLKFYNKYREMKSKLKKNPKDGQPDPMKLGLMEHAKPLLRCEIRLHKRYLKKHDLIQASSLTQEVIFEHFFNKLERISLGTSEILPIPMLDNLTKNERLAYEVWIRGGDAESLTSKSTFERLRNRALELEPGVDIRLPYVTQIRGRSLKSYLEPNNIAEPPDFLIDTSWYYDPSQRQYSN